MDHKWNVGLDGRHNLSKARVVLYATPDLKPYLEPYRDDAIYLPTPIDTSMFRPLGMKRKPVALRRDLFY